MNSAFRKELVRPGLDDYFMMAAALAATRGTCPRKRVGAVLVASGKVVSTGYNGSPPGADHCDETGCLVRPTGDGKVGCVRTVHAEANALAHAARHGVRTEGTTLYCTCSPCLSCAKLALSAGVSRLVYAQEYSDSSGIELLSEMGVSLGKVSERLLEVGEFARKVCGNGN